MDDADKASGYWDTIIDASIKLAGHIGGAPEPTGRCFNCDEAVPHPHRWCDKDCLTDWEKRNGNIK